MDTKEKILQASLKLFARDGYEAVSVSMIAGELGITKGALYKHYENKRAIFDSIVSRMEEQSRRNIRDFRLPEQLFDNMPESCRNSELEKLCAATLAQFLYWTGDGFAARFRRMLSVERYRNREMNSLYQKYLGTGPLRYAEEVLGKLPAEALGGRSPRQMALEFYSPVFSLISLYDGTAAAGDMAAALKEHIEYFVSRLAGNLSPAKAPPPPVKPAEKKEAGCRKSDGYEGEAFLSRLKGPNPIKLTERLLTGHLIRDKARVCSICGTGLSSVFLAREYGFRVWAVDPWGGDENRGFFEACGLGDKDIQAVKASAGALPFEHEFFDAIVWVDGYNYFGRDKSFLNEKLLPFLRHGGYVYIALPGMKAELQGRLPRELLLSWNPEQLECIQDIHYWRGIASAARGADLLTIGELEGGAEAWDDWLDREEPRALRDRRAMEAGAGKYLNFLKLVIRKR